MSKTKWYQKPIYALVALALVLSFSLVATTPVAANGGVPDRVTAITNTADRLVAMQSTDSLGLKSPPDFGWTWVITDETQHSDTCSGHSMYGVVALGLLDAYAETSNSDYYDAAKLAADFLKNILYVDTDDGNWTTPGSTTEGAWWTAVPYEGCTYDGGWSFDYQFLERFEDVFPGEGGYDTCAETCWAWQKANVAHYASANAWYTHMVDRGDQTPGQIWWQGADYGMAAQMMGDTTWASGMAAEIDSHLADLDGSSTDHSRFIGWGNAIALFQAVDPTTYATDITTLIGYLSDDQNTDGSWGEIGGNPEGKAQDTGYVIMGLAAVGSADALNLARQGADWLCRNQGYNTIVGGWNEASGSKEYSETDSEALQGLYDVPATVTNTNTSKTYYSIQTAIDAASSGDTINVAAGTYAGAIIDRAVVVDGADDASSVITSGVEYKSGSSLTTAFRLDAGADGTEIRDFTINCSKSSSFYFAVFGRAVDNVIVDGLTVNDAVQGISNWGGSGWTITNNALTDTAAAGGGGIAIFLGALPGTTYPVCSDNLVQGNTMLADGTDPGYTSPGISLALDARGSAIPGDLLGSEDLSNNRIVGNTITGTGNSNEVGIEIGVIGLGGDPAKITATMGIIHDNYVEDNTIENSDDGLYCYVTTNLTVSGNTIKNCSDCGVYMKDDNAGCNINYNDIYDNSCGLNNTEGATYDRTVDAICNWWGSSSGPYHETLNPGGTGDTVSDYVDFEPWLVEVTTVTTQAATGVQPLSATLNMDYTVGGYSSLQVRFAYKESADTEWFYTDWVSKTADGTHAESLSYMVLNINTDYDFKAQLRYDDTCAGETMLEGVILHFDTDIVGAPGCFIATAAYGTSTAEQLDVLREFRDVVLLESTLGSQFVSLYYQTSPPIADFIAGNEILRTLVRELLVDPIVCVVDATGNMWRN